MDKKTGFGIEIIPTSALGFPIEEFPTNPAEEERIQLPEDLQAESGDSALTIIGDAEHTVIMTDEEILEVDADLPALLEAVVAEQPDDPFTIRIQQGEAKVVLEAVEESHKE